MTFKYFNVALIIVARIICSNCFHHRSFHRSRSRYKWSVLSTTSLNNNLLSAVKTKSIHDVPKLEQSLKEKGIGSKVHVLSTDPLIYLIPDFLSQQECEEYKHYVNNDYNRTMTKSNPPDVSLDLTKLWPLPFLSLAAGIPPYVRLLESSSGTDPGLIKSLSVILPNIMVALSLMAILAWFVILPIIRNVSDTSSRTSVATALNLEQDIDFIRPLVEKTCDAAFGHPWQSWEAPVVTRYEPGAIFAKHGDASPTRGSEWKDLGGQRVVTCICYLNTISKENGGETFFNMLDLAVSPTAGSALFFFPAEADTWKADDRTVHESLPPNVDKWIVQLFGRAQQVPPPLGLPDSFA